VPLSDDAILAAWRDLAGREGVLCEPASAAGLAALVSLGVERRARVVCVVTGHGLKDPETAARLSPPPVSVAPDPDAIVEALEA
jgi:threonine synthase